VAEIRPEDVFNEPSIEEIMDRHGLTEDFLLQQLKQKIGARQEKVFHYQGDVIYSCKLEAHDIQIRALEMAFKLRGLFVSKVEHTGAGGGPIQIRGEMNVEALRNAINRAQKPE